MSRKILFSLLLTGILSCQENEDFQSEDNTGFLEIGVSLDVEAVPANGRLLAVDVSSFSVDVFDASDNLVVSYDPFSSAPAQTELPVGEYYITASSNDLVDSAFESPFYFGRSANFTIDENESKTVDLTVSLANSRVAINYSQNVINSFTAYSGEVRVTTGAGQSTLNFTQGETRAGYFVSGYPLEISVFLTYTKSDGTPENKTLSTTIQEALPKTQYNVNVDAQLNDGEATINVLVDESVDEVDVTLSENFQDLWDEIAALPDIDMGFSTIRATDGSGGIYNSISRDAEATGDVVSWKGFGSNLWSVSNLEPFFHDNPQNFDVWYSNEGAYPQVVDRGDLDKYLRIRNGVSIQYATQPGSISPAQTIPIDIVWVVRLYPNPGNETDGLFRYNNVVTNWQFSFTGPNLDLGLSGGLFNRVYCRFTADASGNWEFRFNDLDKTTPDASGTGYSLSFTEFWFGSNGHPAETHHWTRLINQQPGGFSQTSLDVMQANFEILWPLGKPDFPVDDNAYDVAFNNVTKVWSVSQGNFTGGNGTRGTFEYQWYYWNNEDGITFPIQNRLDEHLPIPGATSSSMDRNDFLGPGQPWDGTSPGNGDIWIMCVVTPKDSNGTEGEKIVTEWVNDNII